MTVPLVSRLAAWVEEGWGDAQIYGYYLLMWIYRYEHTLTRTLAQSLTPILTLLLPLIPTLTLTLPLPLILPLPRYEHIVTVAVGDLDGVLLNSEMGCAPLLFLRCSEFAVDPNPNPNPNPDPNPNQLDSEP